AVSAQLAASGAEAQAAAMTGPLVAIREVAAAFAGVRAAIAPAPEKAPAPAAPRPSPARAPARPRKRRGHRAGEGDPPAWGWTRAGTRAEPDDDARDAIDLAA